MPGHPTGTAAGVVLYGSFSESSKDSAHRAADRRALALRLRHAKTDTEAAARRAKAAVEESRLLIEESHRRRRLKNVSLTGTKRRIQG